METAESARRHGVTDEDMQHAIRNAVRTLAPGDGPYEGPPYSALFIGADHSGKLLEVIVLDDDPDEPPVVIHAMPLREKFWPYLPRR